MEQFNSPQRFKQKFCLDFFFSPNARNTLREETDFLFIFKLFILYWGIAD